NKDTGDRLSFNDLLYPDRPLILTLRSPLIQ
ncbi:MAG: hypothetical protein RLZZ532_2415, partial [Cyanobacteriota bacterium]